MTKLPRNLGASRPIDIGAEPDFCLGCLTVHPSTREVSVDGHREKVEPRVMQVLAVLVRAEGIVVSRDRLIEQCWGGRLVGDDAINSCVAKVRVLATLTTPPAFEIETIPRVGYRLHARTPVASEHHTDTPTLSVADLAQRPSARVPKIWNWVATATTCIAMLIAGVVWWLLRPGPSLEWAVVESHQPFIGTPLIERYPAISPDGTMLAYSAGPNLTSRQIYLRLFKGDSSIQLTHEAYDATSPTWSSDGTTIAYSVFRDGHPCQIMEMEIPSGTPRPVGRCHIAERAELTFDPSGHALVFADSVAQSLPTRLVRVDIESGRVTWLTDPPGATLGDNAPSFSPDGRYLVYFRNLGGIRSDMRLRRISDGRENIVEMLNGCDASAAWTPDGAAILISRNCLGSYSLWAYSLDGKTEKQIFNSTSGIGRLSVNPNGTVAMETFGSHAPIMAFKPKSNQSPTLLDEAGGLTSYCADFAPDGALVATGSRGTQLGVWIADHEGAPFRKLMSLPQFACAIRWSPDGTQFAFVQPGPAGGFDVPVVRRDGQVVTRIDYPGTETDLLDWTADGKSILTTRLDKQGWRIWRTDLATPAKAVPITPPGWIDPRVHGSMLFAQKYGAIGTWRLDTPAPERVADGPTLESSDLINISGDNLYFADLTDPKHPAIAMQSVYGGKKRRVIPLPFGNVDFTFAVNPKSGDLVFSRQPSDDSDIGLVRLQRR